MLASALTAACLAGPAFAEPDLFSRETVSGQLDLRVAAADGERSWVDGGFGKTRYGGDAAGDFDISADVADAIVEWRPRLTWSLSGYVTVEVQPDQRQEIDVNEAYLVYKPLVGETRVKARLGLFYPPVSLEHDGVAWSVARTITPSAINSWIGEEVKVIGLEVSGTRSFGGHELGLMAATFGNNDTSGTLLSFRGWSVSDVRTTPYGDYVLPRMSPFLTPRQAPTTEPQLELDGRLGYYVRADWRPPAPVAFNVLYYDNAGDMIAVDRKQWSWDTRFVNVGMTWQVGENTEVLAQAMSGVTLMGYPFPIGRWVDVDYEAAYLLASHTRGAGTLTGRVDWFETTDNAPAAYGNLSEDGWAATAAYRHTFSPNLAVVFEALRVSSERPSRTYGGLPAKQDQTTIQASGRLSF